MIETAHAILLLQNRYVLQLRDRKPGIAAPGRWSLFGGRMEPGERPAAAMRREIREELSIPADEWHPLGPIDHFAKLEKQQARLWLFWGRVDKSWPARELKEGRAVRAFSFARLAALDMPVVMRRALERFHRTCRP